MGFGEKAFGATLDVEHASDLASTFIGHHGRFENYHVGVYSHYLTGERIFSHAD